MKRYTFSNIKAYLQGKIRYKLYYSRFKFLIPRHIREQIDIRINSMDPVCYEQGQCKLCGCQTTALQMANKACDKPCYPEMLSRKTWKWLVLKDENKNYWALRHNYWWTVVDNKFVRDE